MTQCSFPNAKHLAEIRSGSPSKRALNKNEVDKFSDFLIKSASQRLQPRVSQMFLLREKNYPVNFMLATAAGYEYGKSSILNAFGVPALGFSRQTLLTYTEKKEI